MCPYVRVYLYVTFFFLLTLMNERAKCADFFANHFQTVYFLAKLELQDLKKSDCTCLFMTVPVYLWQV